jgi:hypothetical protein
MLSAWRHRVADALPPPCASALPPIADSLRDRP